MDKDEFGFFIFMDEEECGADAPESGVWDWCVLRGRMISAPTMGAARIRPGLA